VSFVTSPAFWKLSRILPGFRFLPGAPARFVRLSAALVWLIFLSETARFARSVLMRSSNYYPLGNCDWPGPETCPDA